MKKRSNYFLYVLKHKLYVFIDSIRLGILFRGLVHDWSKFLPSEYVPYKEYFATSREEKEEIKNRTPLLMIEYNNLLDVEKNFAYAWLYHQKRNRHHWQYWLIMDIMDTAHTKETKILVEDSGKVFCLNCNKTIPEDCLIPLQMPEKYVKEMVADWYGAGKAMKSELSTLQWFEKNKHIIKLHKDTEQLVHNLLGHKRYQKGRN